MSYRICVKTASAKNDGVGWGAIVRVPNGETWELAGSIPYDDAQTVIRATLLGIVEALATLPKPGEVHVSTDVQYIADGCSKYLDKWVARGWRRKDKKRVAHRDLWELIIQERNRHQLTVTWKDLGQEGRLAQSVATIGQEGERWFKRHLPAEPAPYEAPP